jgi:integrase
LSKEDIELIGLIESARKGVVMAKVKKIVNKGKVSWNVDYRTPEGQRVQKRFDYRKDADDYLAKITVAIKEDTYETLFERRKEAPLTFDELAAKYTEICQFDKSFPEFKRYIIPILRQGFGEKLLPQITALDLESFRNERRAGISRRGTVRSAARVNRELAVLKHIFNKAVKWGLLDKSPFSRGDKLLFKEENHRLRYLMKEECEALLAQCSDHLRPIVKMALNTGMRRGEILNLRWEHVNDGGAYVYTSKSMKPRLVPLNEAALEVIQEMRQKNQLRSPFVFCDKHGKAWKDVKQGFGGACRRSGIVDFRFHDLRHTFASHLAMNGYSMKAIADLLGHTSLAMVMRYAHLSPGHLHDAVNSVNFGGRKPFGKHLENNPLKRKRVSNHENR